MLAFPYRLSPLRHSFPGASLLIAPVLTGAAMGGYGNYLRRREKEASSLATFWGGGLFAFSMAAMRFLMVKG